MVEVEDDCGGDDGPGERSAPDLVDAADEAAAGELEVEIRHRQSTTTGAFSGAPAARE
ncbi:MAG TPA: hypothetical protein VKI43_00855 [Vicinamibacterales bacterium]|nr:hypothetical protein [Vicinamibacterales bacterium]